nr:hypothetical protein [Methylobacterium sp. L1A1]
MSTFVDTVAPARFARYLAWANNDAALAHRLYARNVALAEAFYTPLHTLEIVLRNRVDDALSAQFTSNWFNDPAVVRHVPLQRKVQDAHRKLASLGTGLTRGHVVAELSLGFWTGMFNRHQHHLWQHLRPIFVGARGIHRRSVSGQLDDVRGLRNRIAHYEPIVQLNLLNAYQEIETLTQWLSPQAALWTATHSRLLAVCPPQMIIVNGQVNPALTALL